MQCLLSVREGGAGLALEYQGRWRDMVDDSKLSKERKRV